MYAIVWCFHGEAVEHPTQQLTLPLTSTVRPGAFAVESCAVQHLRVSTVRPGAFAVDPFVQEHTLFAAPAVAGDPSVLVPDKKGPARRADVACPAGTLRLRFQDKPEVFEHVINTVTREYMYSDPRPPRSREAAYIPTRTETLRAYARALREAADLAMVVRPGLQMPSPCVWERTGVEVYWVGRDESLTLRSKYNGEAMVRPCERVGRGKVKERSHIIKCQTANELGH